MRKLFFDEVGDSLNDGLVVERAIVFSFVFFGWKSLGGASLLLLLGLLLFDLLDQLQNLTLLAVDE